MSAAPPASLKQRAAQGLLWGSLSNVAQQALNLIFGIVLGRLLTPNDYGMVGMLAIFSLIAATLQESGFTAALANRKDIDHRDYNAVFWFCLPLSLGLYALLFLAAPLIADFYATPALVPLSRYAFLAFVISGLGIAPSARLFKTLRVKERTQSNLLALLLSGLVGIALAYAGFSYWGIATQTLVYVSVNTLCYWWHAAWRPSLDFDFRPIREMASFSSLLLLTNVLSHVNNNFFAVVLGRVYGGTEVGNYNQANKWNFMGHSLVSGMVQGVAQPLFVATADEAERQARVFRKLLRFTCFLAFPVMLGLAFIARELILLAIGAKWLAAAQMLSCLCLSGAMLPPTTLYTQFLLSRGQSATYLKGLLSLVLTQLLALLCTYSLGLLPMLLTYVALNVLWMGLWHHFVRKLLPIGYGQALRDVLPLLLATLLSLGMVYALLSPFALPLWGSLLLKIALAALIYPALLWLAKAEVLRESLQYLRKQS